MEDKNILDHKVGETTIKEMSALSFLQWLANKIDGTRTYSAAATELRMAVQSAPVSRIMPDTDKINYVRKLLSLGITI